MLSSNETTKAGFETPETNAKSILFASPVISELKEGAPQMQPQVPSKPRKEIDSLFDLDEDPQKPVEKYGDEIDISDDEKILEETEDEDDENEEGTYNASKDVPHSLPMKINFGPRGGPISKEPKIVKGSVPIGSIYENMQMLSRSIQSSDYRNRVWGTKPESASDSYGYSQSYQTQGFSRPRAIFCDQVAERVNISEETLEENSASLETPK